MGEPKCQRPIMQMHGMQILVSMQVKINAIAKSQISRYNSNSQVHTHTQNTHDGPKNSMSLRRTRCVFPCRNDVCPHRRQSFVFTCTERNQSPIHPNERLKQQQQKRKETNQVQLDIALPIPTRAHSVSKNPNDTANPNPNA